MKLIATYCFVDVAGFTALTEAHGDDTAADLALRFTTLAEQAIGADGRLVKTIGDAVLVTMPTPGQAIEVIGRLWALAVAEPDFPILRAGLNHGVAVERAADVYGAAVNVAARLASHAGGGEVLATSAVAAAARELGMATVSLGPVSLRHVREPVEIFSLTVGHVAGTDAIDPVCHMRVDTRRAPGRLRVEENDYWFCSLRCASLFASSPNSYIPS